MTDGSNVFRAGMPYAPDILRLEESIPAPMLEEGRVIEHETLEGILSYPRGSQRYYAVVNAWMHKTRNISGVFMAWEPTKGVKVLDPSQVLDHAETRTRQKIRQTGRAVKLFGWVDRNRLNETGKQRLDHQARVAQTIRTALESARKELAVDLVPVKSLPKRSI